MSVTATALKKIDERAALRVAIENASSTKAALAKAQASLEAATEHVARAEARLRTASAAVAQTREEHIGRVARALGDGREPPTAATSVQASRDAEIEARDEKDAAKAAVEQIAAGIADLETDMRVASKAVDKVLAETLEPTLRRLIAEARAHRARFLQAQAALTVVSGLWSPWDEIRKEADRVGVFNPDADARVADPARRAWETALKALRESADAELPPIDGMTTLSRM
jgi:hypothetical protein